MNISFAHTKAQFRARSKDVTRRLGWLKLKAGDILQAVEKGQGLKAGEHPVKLGRIEIVSIRREPLRLLLDCPEYGRAEVDREGFPNWSPEEFCRFFASSHKGVDLETPIARIEYKYLEDYNGK